MDVELLKKNARVLYSEMQWLAKLIDVRMKLYWKQECEYSSIDELLPPD
jgi:hypothetical protein